MPKIKLERIISCSSEDPEHLANNLLNSETKKKWKSKTVGENLVSIIFQLQKSCLISGIDIGNENSSFVEVLVGRSTCQENDYKIILAMSSFMTPMEARNLTNNNRVRMFTYDDLASSTRDEQWDRVKVVCTQPFNKHVQYGLSFINLHTPQEQKSEERLETIGKFNIRPDSPNVLTTGSLFAKRKELYTEKKVDNQITVAQAIKTCEKPKGKIHSVQSSASSKTRANESDEKNRNRKALFYDTDEEEDNEKIDKTVNKIKTEDEKPKIDQKPIKKKNIQNLNSPKPSTSTKNETNSKRKINTPPKISNKKRKTITKPFNQLLSGVVFTISGIVNPERANLRTLALNLGAKYRPDWDNTCTHLICAFANTPKFNQVRGKGKIVTKLWIKDCHEQRKRLPWRRYALDRNDQGKPESEDEIEETIDEPKENEIAVKIRNDNIDQEPEICNVSGSDTDDEVEKILAKQKEKASNGVNNDSDNDPFNADTDEEKFKKDKFDIEEIPKIFQSEVFYIDDALDEDDKNKLQRLIKAFDGVVLTSLRNIVDFVLTNEEFVDSIKERFDVKCINYKWIYECHDVMKRIPYEHFSLNST